MKVSSLKSKFPAVSNIFLALLAACLLILSFPDFEFSILAWFALVPLFVAVEREKESRLRAFFAGWIFGTIFFFGTCWWLTFAPIHYAEFPPFLAYLLMFCVALTVGIFPAIFCGLFSILLKRLGNYAIFAAPFLWTFTEFLRFWVTGNNWNTIGYSQAFNHLIVPFGSFGGVLLVSFICAAFNAFYTYPIIKRTKKSGWFAIIPLLFINGVLIQRINPPLKNAPQKEADVIVVQPNVPMSGIKYEDRATFRERHVQLAEQALQKIDRTTGTPAIIIFPESPMMFFYTEDAEFREFLKRFATKNNAFIVFNSAEPDAKSTQYFNSAVMVDQNGGKIAQYDKIHLLPFGEFQPLPEFIASGIPAFVGNFSFGDEYDLLPFGDAKGGVMICFESHFGLLSREYVRRGADVLIEMTNDGYLGKTPVLRQHLANSVFRAVETNRPLIRVTNVGVTAYINELGEVSDEAEVYSEAARAWTVSKSDGSQTLYVRYGEWFAWLCSIVTLGLIILSFLSTQRRKDAEAQK
jgi:apolipoprotein N-acyltransferase